MSECSLTAGVARVDITPPLGFRMQGIVRRTAGAVGVETPLSATVLVLADAKTKIAIFDCDLLGFDLPLVAEIRATVAEALETEAHCIALGCTHTHNGPCTIRHVLGGPHDVGCPAAQREAQEAYIAHLVGELRAVAVLADSRRQPARAGAGRGEAAAAVNREELNDDGRILVGRNPEGIVDHSVDVLRVDDLEGQPIAVLVGYAAHPVVMGMDSELFSPDYPGVVRRIVEAVTGASCLFLTGAAGNQATWSFLQGDWGEKERMGGLIGCEAARVFFEVETRPHEVVREVGASLSGLALYRKEFSGGPTHRLLQAATATVEVPLQPLPTLAEAEARLAVARAALGALEREDAPMTKMYPAQLVARWAEGVAEKVKGGIERESLSFAIVGFRLDDFALLGMPGEPFVEIGLAVKARSRAGHTMFAGYCNGSLAYWPTAETVARGGMAVSSSLQTYNISAAPVAETTEVIVGGFEGVLRELGI
jgi:hypothetical protein